ncbi:MAG: type II toxin-antitoxin system PemK/MazF family toxin [Rickettsiales bacterium]
MDMAGRGIARSIKRFEVYWTTLDPAVGHEMQKTRPCMVITPDKMNRLLGTVIIAPITSTQRSLPFRANVEIKGKKGQIALDQLRTVDKSRIGDVIEMIRGKDRQEILAKLEEMFAE